jgi:protein transport protein SEC24
MASPPPPGAPYSDPLDRYGPDPYAQQQQQPPAQYGQAPQPGYPPQQSGFSSPSATPGFAPPPPTTGTPAHAGRGKRRGYAEQQFEFGQGANAALTPNSGGMGGPYQQPVYPVAQPGYPQQEPVQQQPQFVQPMGMQQGGYPGIVGPGTGYDPVSGVTQQFGQMGMGGAAPMQAASQMMPQPQGMQKAQGLNQLFTVDLMQQPFNAAELDLPPPEIILPPNVRLYCISWWIELMDYYRRR